MVARASGEAGRDGGPGSTLRRLPLLRRVPLGLPILGWPLRRALTFRLLALRLGGPGGGERGRLAPPEPGSGRGRGRGRAVCSRAAVTSAARPGPAGRRDWPREKSHAGRGWPRAPVRRGGRGGGPPALPGALGRPGPARRRAWA